MGVSGQSITLANSIIGVGILAMPFCFQQCGVLLATLILLLMGLVSRCSSYFLLKSAIMARRSNFEFLAFHVFGPVGKLAVEIGIIGFLMGTCIAYFVVVGDLGPQIISKIFNINQSDFLRTFIMVVVSVLCVLPLGLLRNVDSLSNVSAATICFYFCLVMKVIADAASQMFNNDWSSKLELWKPSGVLQCVPIFSMALFCQTQLFEIFESMPTLSLEKMNLVTKNAINVCTSVYLTLGIFGYIAFSSQTISGNILISLSPTMANDVIKLGFVLSLAFSFPLIIFPCRASLYSLIYRSAHLSHHDNIINHSIPEGTFRLITVAIVGVALFISILIPNIELVLGLVGSTIGVLICVVFPSACFIHITFKNTNERILAKVMLVLGLFILVLGTFANLQAAESSIDRYDDKYTQENIDKIVKDFFDSKKIENSEETISKRMDKILEDKDEKNKESIAQPPNPVPPEIEDNKHVEANGANEVHPKEIKNIEVIKENNKFETHPKNLVTKREETVKINGAAVKDPKQKNEPAPPVVVEEKIAIIKEQKLMETMHQKVEEQKELMKEQKEILLELQKLQNDKKDKINSNEAKKIAVESIQQIANMAIQSLSAVTEKAVITNSGDVNNKPQEKLEAVQELAKQAVERIEAIKVDNKPQEKLEAVQELAKQAVERIEAIKVDSVQALKSPGITDNKIISQQSVQNPVVPSVAAPDILKVDQNEVKPHSHSPDEPQSYKQGEDAQIVNNNVLQPNKLDIIQKVAAPVAPEEVPQSIKSQIPPKVNQILHIPNNIPSQNIPNIVQPPNVGNNEQLNAENNVRQKREVVDCTNKTVLKPEDKKICETLVTNNNVQSQNVILPSVDLEKDLSRILPGDSIVHSRSLKNYQESSTNR